VVPPPAVRRAGFAALTALLFAACAAAPAATTAAAPATTAPAASTTGPVTTTTAEATTTTTVETTTTETEPPLRLSIVYDNTAADPRFGAAWGFSALVEAPGGTLLFDTGGDGALLLENLALLGIDPASIEIVVLSHEHEDHTGGLWALLDAGAAPAAYVPASFSAGFKTRLAARATVIEVTAGPMEILPGVFSTGEIGNGIVEQALAIRTAAGTVVLTGCAHPGIVDIVERAGQVVPGGIALVIGGFHLLEAAPAAIDAVVAAFRDIGVRQVAPTHCTGDAAIAAFAREYGDDFVAAGAGRVIEAG
jgi:7,8-dihydropterin-6-yl-methyl-4-(beta-D-ribofuranosyl)aminobenzene 5'-phosphate synthase